MREYHNLYILIKVPSACLDQHEKQEVQLHNG